MREGCEGDTMLGRRKRRCSLRGACEVRIVAKRIKYRAIGAYSARSIHEAWLQCFHVNGKFSAPTLGRRRRLGHSLMGVKINNEIYANVCTF